LDDLIGRRGTPSEYRCNQRKQKYTHSNLTFDMRGWAAPSAGKP
jgi:hypothetical protein